MEDMNKKIQDAIQESLPAQVGEALRERLTLLAKLEVSTKAWQENVERLQSENDLIRQAHAKTTGQLAEANAALVKFKAREADFEMSERRVELADLLRKAAESAKSDILNLAQIAFRNPVLKSVETISENRNVPVSGQYGVSYHNENRSETRTRETTAE